MKRHELAILGWAFLIACSGSSPPPRPDAARPDTARPDTARPPASDDASRPDGAVAPDTITPAPDAGPSLDATALPDGPAVPDASPPDANALDTPTDATTPSPDAGPEADTQPADATPRDLALDLPQDRTPPDADRLEGPGATAGDAPSSDLAPASPPAPAAILEALRRANDFFTTQHPDPTADIVTEKVRPSNLWTRAVYYEGLMGLHAIEPEADRQAAYYDYAVTWGASPGHPWSLTYTPATSLTNNADNMACGQTYLDLYELDPQPERIAVLKASVDDMVAKGTTTAWTWIDALQMAMPIFARFGVLFDDRAYFDEMWALYRWTRDVRGGGLYNPTDGLWWRDWHFTPGGGLQQAMTRALHDALPGANTDADILAPNGKNLYWSRGNGWVLAALARVLDVLPPTDPHHATYLADFQAMAAALLPLQRPDGFWTSSLLDPTHCASLGLPGQDGPETSGTALFAYGLAWGLRKHVLEERFRSPLLAAWRGLVDLALQPDGRLGYVQSTGDRPCTDTAPLSPTRLANFDDYGVGVFLLAGSELYRLTTD